MNADFLEKQAVEKTAQETTCHFNTKTGGKLMAKKVQKKTATAKAVMPKAMKPQSVSNPQHNTITLESLLRKMLRGNVELLEVSIINPTDKERRFMKKFKPSARLYHLAGYDKIVYKCFSKEKLMEYFPSDAHY
jgi:hypothetical protein